MEGTTGTGGRMQPAGNSGGKLRYRCWEPSAEDRGHAACGRVEYVALSFVDSDSTQVLLIVASWRVAARPRGAEIF